MNREKKIEELLSQKCNGYFKAGFLEGMYAVLDDENLFLEDGIREAILDKIIDNLEVLDV